MGSPPPSQEPPTGVIRSAASLCSVRRGVGDVAPVLAAVGAILTALGVLVRNIGRLRRLFGIDQAELVANLRELADTWEEKYGLVTTDLVVERSAHAATKEELRLERDAGARCRRELDSVQSELRLIGRRRPGTAR